jgi:hypothetical protein
MTGIKSAYVGYDDIVRQFGEEKIQGRYEYFLKIITVFIEKFGYVGRVTVNEITLWYSLFDYFSDIARLKSFHNIDKINEVKILSYEIYWLLKRKPLQPVTNDIDTVYVNEQFVLVTIVHFLQNGNKEFASLKNNDKLNFFIDSLYYFLKYRHCDAQMLELMLISFKAGETYAHLLGEK